MNRVIFIYVMVVCALCVAEKKQTLTEEYCWRDYEGIIPSDALSGGLDRNAKPIYIGQVLFESKLIPGKIYTHDGKIYYEWGGQEYSTAENVKILCSPKPEKFEWIPTNNTEVTALTGRILLRGGFEPNHDTYIGRALVDAETSVGKVICTADSCLGLFTTNKGHTRDHKIFEILTYNPNSNSIPIDVRHE